MAGEEKAARPWQVRLAPEEDDATATYAERKMASKNDVVRQALRFFFRVESEAAKGSRLLLVRSGPGGKRETVELWLV